MRAAAAPAPLFPALAAFAALRRGTAQPGRIDVKPHGVLSELARGRPS